MQRTPGLSSHDLKNANKLSPKQTQHVVGRLDTHTHTHCTNINATTVPLHGHRRNQLPISKRQAVAIILKLANCGQGCVYSTWKHLCCLERRRNSVGNACFRQHECPAAPGIDRCWARSSRGSEGEPRLATVAGASIGPDTSPGRPRNALCRCRRPSQGRPESRGTFRGEGRVPITLPRRGVADRGGLVA